MQVIKAWGSSALVSCSSRDYRDTVRARVSLTLGTEPLGEQRTLASVAYETAGAMTTTDGAQADIPQRPHLLHGTETTLVTDKAYWRQADLEAWQAAGKRDRVNPRGAWTASWDAIDAARSRDGRRARMSFKCLHTHGRS